MTSKTWFMVLIVLTMVSLKINAEIVTNDLVSWWKFDENGNTTVASDSAGGNDGSLSSGFGANPTWTNDTPGAASSGALFFDGINDDIDCGNGFAAISNEITVEVWIKHLGTGNGDPYDVYLSKYQDSNYRWFFRANSNNTASAFGRSGGSNIFTAGDFYSDAKISLNTWHHVALTATRNGACVWYIDGKEAGISTTADVSFSNTASLIIGDLGTTGNNIHAIMDDICIYNRALSAEEILQNYRVVIPVSGTIVIIQ